MMIMIDLKHNYIEIDGNKDPDLNLVDLFEKISQNIDKYEVQQVNIREELIKMLTKKIIIKKNDIVPRAPIHK
jgi:hypothetical protein